MLLFEHKQYLQSCGAESSMQTEISSFKILAVLMPTKTTGKGLQRVTSRVWYVTDPDKPRPREHAAKGARPCCAALEKRKRKLGVHVKIYIWIVILSSNDSNGFTSFKINVLKQRILILSVSVSAHTLHLSLSFRSSDQLQQTVPIIHLFLHSY